CFVISTSSQPSGRTLPNCSSRKTANGVSRDSRFPSISGGLFSFRCKRARDFPRGTSDESPAVCADGAGVGRPAVAATARELSRKRRRPNLPASVSFILITQFRREARPSNSTFGNNLFPFEVPKVLIV